MSLGGVLLGLCMLLVGIACFHYGIDSEIVVEKKEQGLAIGTGIFCFILGNSILNIEARKL